MTAFMKEIHSLIEMLQKLISEDLKNDNVGGTSLTFPTGITSDLAFFYVDLLRNIDAKKSFLALPTAIFKKKLKFCRTLFTGK